MTELKEEVGLGEDDVGEVEAVFDAQPEEQGGEDCVAEETAVKEVVAPSEQAYGNIRKIRGGQ